MANFVKGVKVRVEIGYTEGTPKTVTAISLADPAVATSAGNNLQDGSVGYMDLVEGMAPIDGQAIRVAGVGSPQGNSITLEGINSTDYPDFTSGVFVPVTAWQTLSQATQYHFLCNCRKF
jgi:hypothetical protein